MLYYSDPERLINKEGLRGFSTWISLGRGNGIDFQGGLGTGGDMNRRDQVVGWRERVLEEMTGIGGEAFQG